jgi:hypothetical protein
LGLFIYYSFVHDKRGIMSEADRMRLDLAETGAAAGAYLPVRPCLAGRHLLARYVMPPLVRKIRALPTTPTGPDEHHDLDQA